MRILLILRGAPGCGKTTWVKDNRLIPYSLAFDNIRMLFKSPIQTIYGRESSDRKKDALVFDTMLMIMEERMKSGELTVIDAVNSKEADLNEYYELALKYRYKMYIVDFTTIPVVETKNRNLSRMARKRVPDHIVDKVYAEFKTQIIPPIQVIKPEELNTVWPKPIKLDSFKKIHHIGDIHGCLEVLQNGIKACGGIKEDEFYIFLGDYTDRGPKSAEVLMYLMTLKEKENVVFCEGNHEAFVWNWSCNIKNYPEDFEVNTKPQLESAGMNKKEVRKFYRTFQENFYYKYYGKEILACHGGISLLPDNLATISANQYIHGVGLYSDLNQIARTFNNQSYGRKLEVFGHRNPDEKPMKLNDSVYCLEGKVETGGCLRWLVLEEGKIEEIEYHNVTD